MTSTVGTHPTRPSRPVAYEVRMLRSGALACAALVVPAVLVSSLTAGRAGAAGAGAALLLVAAFFALSMLVVSWAGRVSTQLMLWAALGVYLGKIVLLGAALAVAPRVSALDHAAFAWTIFTATVCWVVAEAVWLWRAQLPYVVVPAPGAGSSDPAPGPDAR